MKKTFVPAEWNEQSAVWLTWPSMPKWWADVREESLYAFANLAATLSLFEKVKINCVSESKLEGASTAKDAIERIAKADANMKNIEFFNNPTDDVWCRDSGAVFRLNDGALEAIDFSYNAWGGKFPPWDADDVLASKMAQCANAKVYNARSIVCEGGALEFDGNGNLMTTECVILNKNRNPKITKDIAEEIFAKACGIDNVIWLPDGLFGDDTDGHIDNIARFTPDGKVLTAVCSRSNPSYASLHTNKNLLRKRGIETIDLPIPDLPVIAKYADSTERILPASYANYLVLNSAIIMPSYNQPSDDVAAEILAEVFNTRAIVQLDSEIFLREGGAIHCLTQQEPVAKK